MGAYSRVDLTERHSSFGFLCAFLLPIATQWDTKPGFIRVGAVNDECPGHFSGVNWLEAHGHDSFAARGNRKTPGRLS